MCGNGAECTTAEASPMDVDGELYHIICGNPLSFVFRMGKAGIGQIVRMVKLFLAHRRIRRIDNDHFIIYLLCDTGSRIFIGFFFDVPEIAGLFLFCQPDTLHVSKAEYRLRQESTLSHGRDRLSEG